MDKQVLEALEESFGIYNTDDEESASLSKNFVLPLELMEDWRQCGVVSDFVARDQSNNYRDAHKSANVLSTITNELLENAVKFSYDKNKLVTLTLHSYKCALTIETVNSTRGENISALKTLISDLETKDIETLYFEQLEKTFEEGSDESGMGFLGLIKDFGLNIGFKIKKKLGHDNTYDIFVKVKIENDNIDSL